MTLTKQGEIYSVFPQSLFVLFVGLFVKCHFRQKCGLSKKSDAMPSALWLCIYSEKNAGKREMKDRSSNFAQ